VPAVRRDRQRRREHDVDAAAEQVGDGGAGAAIGHVQHVDAGHLLEQRAREMRCRPHARGTERDLARVLPGVGDQLSGGLRRHRRIGHQDVGGRRNQRDRRELARDVERSGSGAVARKRQDGAGRGHQQRIAIGGRACYLARPEQTRGTRPGFGADRRAPEVLQVDAEDAAEDIGCPSRWKWNDDAYRPAGEVLRLRRRRKGKEPKGQHQQHQSRHDALLLAPVCHSEFARTM
jgi:hypothetical protein